MTTILDLNQRTGWPSDLKVLLERYPREVWPAHPNLGPTARFWLQRHDMFRELGGALKAATSQFREDLVAPTEFRTWFVPRLEFFLSELHGHHQVEDHHYFPRFRAAEPRLLKGFEVLDRDHAIIHDAIGRVVEAANELLGAMHQDAQRRASHRYADVSDRLLSGLIQHLADEEDLVVPLILDRGEEALQP
jgi:iron-sulfur cluster repair protein YtfE (RIC family)